MVKTRQSTIASTFFGLLIIVFNAYNRTLIVIKIYERTLSIGLFLHVNNSEHKLVNLYFKACQRMHGHVTIHFLMGHLMSNKSPNRKTNKDVTRIEAYKTAKL